MATLQNIGKLKYRGKDGQWHPLPVVVQDTGGGVSTISGKGAPTSETQGKVNQLYRDEDTQKLYICTATDGGYTWEAVVSDTEDAVTYTAQTLTNAQKTQARANIGAGTSNFSGSYNDLSNKPNIPAATVIDTTLTKSGQAADAKAVGDAIGKKIDKAQGTGNAGKILGIGADGNVTPQDKPAQALAGASAPTNATAGVVGQEYYVIVNNAVTEMYVCTAVANGTYTWGKVEFGAEESDPTVPSWAKEAQKPSYTASEVGADPSGTASSQVSAHNTGTDTHSDIRLLISGLTERLNALADSDDTTLDQLSEVVAYIKSNRTLIESITTSKVNVTDIIDNLTTNVTNKPLSAAQGVALKALIDGILIPDKLPNPNALTFTGAVTGSYDGSAPLEVEIPSGGGGLTVTNTAAVGEVLTVEEIGEDGKPKKWKTQTVETAPPDWMENDSNNPGFVKNRTHYKQIMNGPGNPGYKVNLLDGTHRVGDIILLQSVTTNSLQKVLMQGINSPDWDIYELCMLIKETDNNDKTYNLELICKDSENIVEVNTLSEGNIKVLYSEQKKAFLAYYFISNLSTLSTDDKTKFTQTGVYVQLAGNDYSEYAELWATYRLYLYTKLSNKYLNIKQNPPIPQPLRGNEMIATEQTVENEFGYTLRPIPTINDFIDLGITAAQVGQIIKVKAVDDFGNPHEWEAVDKEQICCPQKTTKECGESETITLADNAEYRLTNVTALTFAYPENDFECWIRLTIAVSGYVAVVLPEGTKYIGSAPTFANGEMWEISIKDGVVIAQKVGDGT